MAHNFVKSFVRTCNYLQDPVHVARFQQLCGVKGSFPAQATKPDVEQSEPAGLRKRSQQRGCVGNGEPGDAAPLHVNGVHGAGGDTARAKPLRRNSLTEDVGQEFLVHNKFLFYLFTFGTELGNETFFIIFFPFVFWNVDPLVSRRLIIVWAWNLFLGQSTKDMVRWSRPASPPVVKVEVFYNSEYSMPSTHAMTGTAIPFCLFMLTYGRWQVGLLVHTLMTR